MSTKARLTDLLSKALGYPSLVIRIQAPTIMRMLDLQRDDVFLDAGCGSGYFTTEIAQKTRLSIGIDLKLKRRLALAIAKQTNKAYAAADMQLLPFRDSVFDKILLSSVLQIVDDSSLLLECHRVLKDEGAVVLTIPTDYCYFRKLNSYKTELSIKAGASKGKAYYSPREVAKVLRGGGFRIVKFEFSPKKWGSIVCEMEIYLWHRFGLPFLSSVFFSPFYSLLFLENRANRQQAGDQIVIKVQKAK
jgi:SAM-dependent methyltransferase